jgi:hypothetical protein
LGNLQKRNLTTPTTEGEVDGVSTTNKKKLARTSGGCKVSEDFINNK